MKKMINMSVLINLKESLKEVYPQHLEEAVTII